MMRIRAVFDDEAHEVWISEPFENHELALIVLEARLIAYREQGRRGTLYIDTAEGPAIMRAFDGRKNR